MFANWCISWCIYTCALIGLILPKQKKDGSSLSSSWKLRSAFFSVSLRDLKGGQNSRLIVWKTVTAPLEAAGRNNSRIVCRLFTLPSVFTMCLIYRYTRVSAKSLCTISYEIPERGCEWG